MSGARDGAALEETGARLGDLLRRALRDRLARRKQGFSLAADEQQEFDDSSGPGVPMLDGMEQDRPVRDRGELR
jgi:hypothetical protein